MTDLQLAVLLRQLVGRLDLLISDAYGELPSEMDGKQAVTQELHAFSDELNKLADNLERSTA